MRFTLCAAVVAGLLSPMAIDRATAQEQIEPMLVDHYYVDHYYYDGYVYYPRRYHQRRYYSPRFRRYVYPDAVPERRYRRQRPGRRPQVSRPPQKRYTAPRKPTAAQFEPAMTVEERTQIQTVLNKLGFNVGSPDGAFGKMTRTGIGKYQKALGVKSTGYLVQSQVDDLLAAHDAENVGTLASMDDIDRRNVQSALNAAGFNVGKPDGKFGPGTRKGIRKYQDSLGVDSTGHLTEAEKSALLSDFALGSETASITPEGTPEEVEKAKPQKPETGSREPRIVGPVPPPNATAPDVKKPDAKKPADEPEEEAPGIDI